MIRPSVLVAMACMFVLTCHAQNEIFIKVSDLKSGNPLAGTTVLVKGISLGTTTDASGTAHLVDIPNGQQVIQCSFIGYKEVNRTVSFPQANGSTMTIQLEEESKALEELVVISTRSSRSIENLPTRVEVISGEELEEKANMKPGDIRMLLSESTGIQVQQTSATTANASIRIQGLDGRYTQILKDGFPLYAGFSGGLGLLQIPPLDLQQVEVVKGSSSTLYGGGAIAGLVNLISKHPQDERELSFLLNGTSAKGLDVSGFYSENFNRLGLTLYAASNSASPYDPADIDLTAIPKYQRYTLNPKLFYDINKKTKLNFGVNTSFENRIGGDIYYINGEGDAVHQYFERNKSARVSTQLAFEHNLNEKSRINVRNNFSGFSRVLTKPDYRFDGKQISSFTEINYDVNNPTTEWIAGINLWTDEFKEEKFTDIPLRNYLLTTFGLFVQNNWSIRDWISIESGVRSDYVLDYGLAVLPRVSALFKISEKVTSRLGGGFGYKAPTIFTEESERIQYQNVLPIDQDINELERSYGINWDVNYVTHIFDDAVTLSVNQLFFYTFLDHPLSLTQRPDELYQFENLSGHIDTKGMETNIKIEFSDFKIFLGYTYTDTRIHSKDESVQNPLTPKHRVNSVVMYEVEDKWKIGAEAYYFGQQYLSDGAVGKQYWICGLMLEKIWEQFSLFINFENYLDSRQTKFDTIYTGTITNPVFRDIYAPMDGFVVNGGIKIRL